MKLATKFVVAASCGLLLAGCGSTDSASYQINGALHSLSMIRNKQFAWDKQWKILLVSARSPECMRRHKLQPAPEGEFKAELFRSLEGNFILQQGNNWYVTETQKCQLQQFKQAPREPGDPIGTFSEKEGLLQFVAAPKSAAPPAAAVSAPATAVEPAPAAPGSR